MPLPEAAKQGRAPLIALTAVVAAIGVSFLTSGIRELFHLGVSAQY